MGHPDKICRICLQDDEPSGMIAPCMCRGSSKWVHRSCLDQWRIHERDRAFSQCTECGFTYHMQAVGGDEDRNAKWRYVKFYMLVSRDVVLLTLALQAIICFLGWIIYLIDTKNAIVDFFDGNRGCEEDSFFWCQHVWSAYYLCGLFSVLVFLGCYGCIFLCAHGCNVGSALTAIQEGPDLESPPPNDGSYVAADRGTSWSDPPQPHHPQSQRTRRYQQRRNGEGCDDCCYTCCLGRRGGGFHYYYCPGCDCNGCDCGDCNRGGNNSNNDCGKETMHIFLVILLVVAIVMAVIGFFVGLVIAVVIGQRILQRHVFLLHKRRLVREFIVKDLEEYPHGVIPTAPVDRGEPDEVLPTAPPEEFDQLAAVLPSAPHEMHDSDIRHLKKLGLLV